MITDKDLARLTNRLQVPLVVQDILDGKESLTGDIQYALHEILSNYQPDSALLCIALSAKRIAQRFMHLAPSMAVLRMDCERIIEDYARLWLDHARKRPVDDNLLMDTLSDIPEDLESLAELLDCAAMYLERKNAEAAGLCEILAIQARSQALIADSFIDLMERHTGAPLATTGTGQDNQEPGKPAEKGANVIPFPYYARA
jgi:hypothetical protein